MTTVTLNGVEYKQVNTDGNILLVPVAEVEKKKYNLPVTSKQLELIHELLKFADPYEGSVPVWFSNYGELVTLSSEARKEMLELIGTIDREEILGEDYDEWLNEVEFDIESAINIE